MKKFTQFAVIAGLLFIMSSGANAWTVHIGNWSPRAVDIKVKGQHLFWTQVDCTVTVPIKKMGECAMPGLICPTEIIIEWTDEMNSVRRSKSVKHKTLDTVCFESTLIIYEEGSDNQQVSCGWN